MRALRPQNPTAPGVDHDSGRCCQLEPRTHHRRAEHQRAPTHTRPRRCRTRRRLERGRTRRGRARLVPPTHDDAHTQRHENKEKRKRQPQYATRPASSPTTHRLQHTPLHRPRVRSRHDRSRRGVQWRQSYHWSAALPSFKNPLRRPTARPAYTRSRTPSVAPPPHSHLAVRARHRTRRRGRLAKFIDA